MGENTTTAVTTTQPAEVPAPVEFSAFNSVQNFEAAQRMARMLASSDLVPEQYRLVTQKGQNQAAISNCIIALEVAARIGASPLAVLQNLYIVHGRPAWASQFLIAGINASGRFSPLRYVVTPPEEPRDVSYSYTVYRDGQKSRQEGKCTIRNQTCYAWATDKAGERLESPRVSIDMAVAEGWYTKTDSKWRTMPELMLRYRAATLFARLYAPELVMGFHTDDEVIDITPVVTEAGPRAQSPAGSNLAAKLAAAPAPAIVTLTDPPPAAPPAEPAPADAAQPQPERRRITTAALCQACTAAGVPFSDFVHATGARMNDASDLPSAVKAGYVDDPTTIAALVAEWRAKQPATAAQQ